MFKEEIVKILHKQIKLSQEEIEPLLEIPPNQNLGDYAFPCFTLAKKYKKPPVEIASDLANKISSSSLINKIESSGPYINFFINKEKLAQLTLLKIIKEKGEYGSLNLGKKERVMIEFFHANTHKGVHIGHVRNICLGESISRILSFTGYKIIRANYQGDIGPHVAKCLWGYLNFKEKPPKEQKGVWLGNLYFRANKKSKESKEVQEEINDINSKLYSKDKEIVKIWKKTRDYCLKDFQELYKDFGVKFNRLYFESEVEKRGIEIAKLLLKRGIAKESEGALIVDLKKYDLGVYVILTKAGHAVYHSKDLALAELKSKEYSLDRSIHVVGKEQELYFLQLFKTLELIKSKLANKSIHLIYGLVMLPEGKMSSREGNIVLYRDLIQKIFQVTEEEIKSRHNQLTKEKLEKRKRQIAFGALKFSMLNKENNKQIIFDWDKAVQFEGETGPYIQYVYARISSILSKTKLPKKADYSYLNKDIELKLISLLAKYPLVIEDVSKHYKPSLLSNYLLELSQSFNSFYSMFPVLQSDEETKRARLHLIYCIKEVIKKGLFLLGIDSPLEM